jgi:hypothetical protein
MATTLTVPASVPWILNGVAPVCPIIRTLIICLNDSRWWDSGADRIAVLNPFVARLGGTRGDRTVTLERGFICADMATRVFAPACLDGSGRNEDAGHLRELPQIVDVTTAKKAQEVLRDAAFSATGNAAASVAAAYASVDSIAYAEAYADAAFSWVDGCPYAVKGEAASAATDAYTHAAEEAAASAVDSAALAAGNVRDGRRLVMQILERLFQV